MNKKLSEGVAVFGLGRSGLGVAMAAKKNGIPVQIFDEAVPTAVAKQDLVKAAHELQIPVTFGWTGDPSDLSFPTLVVNPAVRRDHPTLIAALKQGTQVISELEFAYLISKASIVAITGTNGKSTTTIMTWQCLRAAGKDAVLCGNLFGSGYKELTVTEAAMHSTADQILVAEVSSFQLEWIDSFRPSCGLITNISQDHGDRYDSAQEYRDTKLRMFENQTATDWAILNADDGSTPEAESQLKSRGLDPILIEHQGSNTLFCEGYVQIFGKKILNSDFPFLDPLTKTNGTAALALASCALDWPRKAGTLQPKLDENQFNLLVQGLKEFKGLANRMERIGNKNGVELINNSMCTNPVAFICSIESVQGPCKILMGGVTKEADFHEVGRCLATSSHKVYLYGRDQDKIEDDLGIKVSKFETMEQAFREASRQCVPGDTLILAPGCASQDQFRDFQHRGNVFRELAKEWLNS